MPLAIFGIENTALNLAVTLVILMLLAIWIALIVFTFTDARRRIADPFLVGCATAASFFPFVGTLVYTILRPPEFLDDVRERETDIQESEVRLRHLKHNSCHKCSTPIESDFIRCPACRTRLKEPCPTCSKPVGLNWKVCPYCETTLIAPKRSSRSGSKRPKGRKPSLLIVFLIIVAVGSKERAQARFGRRASQQPQSQQGTGRRVFFIQAEVRRAARRSRPAGHPAPPARNRLRQPRSPRSARRKITVGDDEKSEPINRGDN